MGKDDWVPNEPYPNGVETVPPNGDLLNAPPNVDGDIPKAFTLAGTSCTISLNYAAFSGGHMFNYVISLINKA